MNELIRFMSMAAAGAAVAPTLETVAALAEKPSRRARAKPETIARVCMTVPLLRTH
jgi:hypothetical protein